MSDTTTTHTPLPAGMTYDFLLRSMDQLHTKYEILANTRSVMANCMSLSENAAQASGQDFLWRSAERRWITASADLGFFLHDLKALMVVTEGLFPDLRTALHGPDGGCTAHGIDTNP